MSNPTFTVTRKGEKITFTSAFDTLALAYHALAAHPDRSEFANDLLVRARDAAARHHYGKPARSDDFSDHHIAWLHKLATDLLRSELPYVCRGKDQPTDLNLSKIIEVFDTAFANGKKYPKIVLAEAFDDDRVEVTCKIVRCGSKSKYEGAANIKTANDEWAGRINRNGTVSRGGAAAFAEVEAVLRELAQDPLQVLAQNGIATSQCCYCGRALNDARSREVGYGPICAAKFGLPWGSRKQADAASDEAKVIVKEVK